MKQEDCKFHVSLGNLARSCLNTKNKTGWVQLSGRAPRVHSPVWAHLTCWCVSVNKTQQLVITQTHRDLVMTPVDQRYHHDIPSDNSHTDAHFHPMALIPLTSSASITFSLPLPQASDAFSGMWPTAWSPVQQCWNARHLCHQPRASANDGIRAGPQMLAVGQLSLP